MNSILDIEPLEFTDSPFDKFENCSACDGVGLYSQKPINNVYSVIVF